MEVIRSLGRIFTVVISSVADLIVSAFGRIVRQLPYVINFFSKEAILNNSNQSQPATRKLRSRNTVKQNTNVSHARTEPTALSSRDEAIKMYMGCARGDQLAAHALGSNYQTKIQNMKSGKCPLGFASPLQYQQFMDELVTILQSSGIDGRITLQGSSTTFISKHPEKGKIPDTSKPFSLEKDMKELHYFDKGVVQNGGITNIGEYERYSVLSDLDFAIESPSLVRKFKARGEPRSPMNVGGNYNQDSVANAIDGLWTFKFKWQALLGRDVSFVCHHEELASARPPASPFNRNLTP